MLSFCHILALLLLGAVLPGCASISGDGSRQIVLLRTNPPGATILIDGQEVGRTPRLVEIKRSISPVVRFKSKEGVIEVPLQSKYRWKRSFAGNLGLLTLAPVGWAIDFLTGTAWDVQDPVPSEMLLTDADRRQAQVQRTAVAENALLSAIAPPQAESMSVSDQAAEKLEAHLRGRGKATWLKPYQETLNVFTQNDFDYDVTPQDRRRLYYELGVPRVYESKVTTENGRTSLSSEVINIEEGTSTVGPSLTLRTDAEAPKSIIKWGWWSRLVPNTFGFDFVSEKLVVTQLKQEYQLQSVEEEEWWARGMQFISAVNITNTPARRQNSSGRWELSAIPSIRLSRKFVKATDFPASPGFVEREPRFTRWLASVGYGLEVGYQNGRHFFYFDLIPLARWSEIVWRQGGKDNSATRLGFGAQAELGYLVYFDRNWMLRFFSRSQSEDAENWTDALQSRLGQADIPISVSTNVAGLSIAYRMD